jgi:hypothetical protein
MGKILARPQVAHSLSLDGFITSELRLAFLC